MNIRVVLKSLKKNSSLPSKEQFYSSLKGKKIVTKNMIMFLRFGTNLKSKRCVFKM